MDKEKKPNGDIKKIISILLDWFFPPSCAGCGRISFLWCPSCEEKLFKAMQVAMREKENEKRFYISLQVEEEFRLLDDLDFLTLHKDEVSNAIRSLKYNKNFDMGLIFGKYLKELYDEKNWHIDYVIPVPLGKKRFQERGFNQAEILAKGFCDCTNLSLNTDCLQRKKETRTQVGLNITQREENMQTAFFVESLKVKNKNILLIDDVLTTGATLRACASALLDGGANSVVALTVTSGTFASS